MPPVAANAAARARPRRGVNLQQLQPSPQQQQQQQTKAWLLGAPITKILCIVWAIGSLWVIRKNGNDDGNTYTYNNSYDSNNLWVSALWNGPSNWFFHTSTEAIVGLSFLARYLRRMEQELSSRRFIAWIVLLEIIYIATRFIAVLTFDEDVSSIFVVGDSSVRGPYLFVGAILYWYKTQVPRLYPRFLSSTLMGISFSEKSFPYVWGLYTVCMRGTGSMLVGLAGMVASAIFFSLLQLSLTTTNNDDDGSRRNNTNISIPFIDVPDVIVNMLPWDSMCSIFFLDPSPKIYAPYITVTTSRAAATNLRPGGVGAVNGRLRNNRHQEQATAARGSNSSSSSRTTPSATPSPPPEAIAQLTSMGFEEQRVKEALQVSDNNIERAANLLLMGSQ